MRVVCFYTDLDPRTRESIEAQTPDAEFVYTGDDDYHYWRELDQRWTGESDLVIIEHDMGLRGGELASFAGCKQPWCTFGYSGGAISSDGFNRTLSWCLGCAKISCQVQARNKVGKAPWGSLDISVVRATQMPDRQHVHGEVDHFHDYSKSSNAPVDDLNFPKQEAVKPVGQKTEPPPAYRPIAEVIAELRLQRNEGIND